MLAIEFKYEPNHDRAYGPEKSGGDIYEGKFDVVSSKSITDDMKRVKTFVSSYKCQMGCLIFVDEDGKWYKSDNDEKHIKVSQKAKWVKWGNDTYALIFWYPPIKE